MKKRIVERKVGSDSNFTDDIHPVIQRIFENRNIQSKYDLDHSLKALPNPGLLTGMDSMVAHLMHAIEQQCRLLIVADFDADGATSCAVAKRGLELLGAADVRYTVPDRFKFGYGLTPEIVKVASRENPDFILTVDNGISSIDGVREAQARGIKVLITDHHLPGKELPGADAIVNPNMPEDSFPSKSLAGVGVIFYVLTALRKSMRESGWFQHKGVAEPNLACLLDLVALGTVADVVELDYTNRILVHQGLQRIRKGLGHPGINALLQVAGRSIHRLTSSDLGFAVAPRLNAAGRLDNMSSGIECLLSDEDYRAVQIAEKLDSLNRDRREIESRMKDQALDILNTKTFNNRSEIPAGICLYEESWHQGVVGIVASRIKDRVNRPVIAFASTEEGVIKGSARSITGVHIRDVLSEIAALYPNLLSKFGGHAMAAGLSLKLEDFSEFSAVFDDVIKGHSQDLDPEPTIYTDGPLEEAELTLEFAEMLQNIAPWGHGFPEPLFVGDFEVVESRVLKSQHVKFSLCFPGQNQVFDGIAFFAEQPEGWLEVDTIRLVYHLSVNEFRRIRKVQLMIDYMEILATT